MSRRRKSADSCAASHALDLVGERWALLVVRELVLGPKRFTDLRVGLPDVSPNVLAQRLRELEAAGIVRRRKLPPPAGSRVYELTDWGAELEPVIVALGRWGCRSPSLPTEGALSLDSLILALRTTFDPQAAGHLHASFELRLDGDCFRAETAGGRFDVCRGPGERPDATIETDVATLDALLWRGRPLADALRGGEVVIAGDRGAAKRFLRSFPLPAPAAANG